MKRVSHKEAIDRWERPCRIVLAVSVDEKGKANVITLGWNMFTSYNPLMVAISVMKTHHSHKLISESGEFVIAVPSEDMAESVLFCGSYSGRNVDKFKETKLTPISASKVRPPLIKECLVNLECKVVGSLDTADHTIFVGEVLASWVSEEEKRNLLVIGNESGYEILLDKRGWRLGVIKK